MHSLLLMSHLPSHLQMPSLSEPWQPTITIDIMHQGDTSSGQPAAQGEGGGCCSKTSAAAPAAAAATQLQSKAGGCCSTPAAAAASSCCAQPCDEGAGQGMSRDALSDALAEKLLLGNGELGVSGLKVRGLCMCMVDEGGGTLESMATSSMVTVGQENPSVRLLLGHVLPCMIACMSHPSPWSSPCTKHKTSLSEPYVMPALQLS